MINKLRQLLHIIFHKKGKELPPGNYEATVGKIVKHKNNTEIIYTNVKRID